MNVREIHEHRIHVCQQALNGRPKSVLDARAARHDPVTEADYLAIEHRLKRWQSALERFGLIEERLASRNIQ